MSFIYKNPLSSTQLTSQESVARGKVFGTNYSVLQTGGYMEVYTLNDLLYTIPDGATGLIEYTGNTIPVNYSKRTLPFLPDTLTLNSDNISSGRRRLGMLVYVHETQQTYQYTIPNFESLWNGASGSTNQSSYGTSVTTTTAGGTAFINAWLDDTIEGVSGATRENSRWRIFWGTDWQITGGTYTSETGTLALNDNTGGTITVTGFTSGGGSQNLQQVLDNGNVSTTGLYISGATLTATTVDINGGYIDGAVLGSVAPVTLTSNSATITGGYINGVVLGNISPVTITSNSATITGGNINGAVLGNITPVTITSNNATITGGDIDGVVIGGTTPVTFTSNNVTITGGNINGTNIGLTTRGEGAFTHIYDNNGSTGTTGQILSTTLTGITWIDSSSTDYYVTGGTLSAQGTLTLTRNDGNNVTITGFTAQESDTYVTGATYTESTGILTLTRNDGQTVGAGGFSYIKSLTLSNNNLTITPNIGAPALSQVEAITDLGYSGWGLTGTSTGVFYLGTELPFITGGTFSSGTLTLGINNGLESNIVVTGFDADDTYITGGTYNPTTLTLGNSDGVDITITGFAPEITGGTYSNGTLSLDDNTGGSVDITGITFTSTNIYNTDGQLDGNRVIDQNSNSLTFSGGSVSVGTDVSTPVCALLELASTNQGLLIPRMTQVQRLAINSPIPGLLVFCTDSDGNGQEGMYMYKSNGWVNVL